MAVATDAGSVRWLPVLTDNKCGRPPIFKWGIPGSVQPSSAGDGT